MYPKYAWPMLNLDGCIKPLVPSLASSFRLIPLVPFCPGQLSSFRGHEGEENEKIKGLFSNLVGLSLFVCKSVVDKPTQ